jgi:hypothetical protein
MGEEDDASEQDDDPPIPSEEGAPPLLPEDGLQPDYSDGSPPQISSNDGPSLFPVDEDECLDGEVAAAEKLANEMHSAAVPEAPRIYVPPESLQTVSTSPN